MRKPYFKIKSTAFVEYKKKGLLIKELNAKNGKFLWNVIKGTFNDKKDRSPVETLIRECKEEAGIKINNIRLVSVFLVTNNKTKWLQFNFLAALRPNKNQKNARFSIPVSREKDEEIKEIKLFSAKELRQMRPCNFINKRAYLLVQNWLKPKNKKYSNLPSIVFIKD